MVLGGVKTLRNILDSLGIRNKDRIIQRLLRDKQTATGTEALQERQQGR